jgi:RNA processing factor Prp31
MKITKTQLRKIIREELLKEDDYATQYVDMVDDITKEVNRISVKIR